jgi:hypothetical protein
MRGIRLSSFSVTSNLVKVTHNTTWNLLRTFATQSTAQTGKQKIQGQIAKIIDKSVKDSEEDLRSRNEEPQNYETVTYIPSTPHV